jgi:protease PrsW
LILSAKLLFAIVPVLLFLAGLRLLDSYQLLRFRSVLNVVLLGVFVAIPVYFLNAAVLRFELIPQDYFSRYAAPVIEELLKLLIPLWLLQKKQIGFIVDGAIFGFAAGAGFAVAENLYYLTMLADNSNLLFWALRGAGTAVMHGSTTAIALMIIMSSPTGNYKTRIPAAALTAIFIHSFYNHFIFSPLVMALIQLLAFPMIAMTVFQVSELALRNWLDAGFESDATLLEAIRSGVVRATPQGNYLMELKSRFSAEMVVDMLCYLRLQLELAVAAKGLLLMREAGFDTEAPIGTREKFAEMKGLQKALGFTGMAAMKPLLHHKTQDLWQLHFLDTSTK